MQSSGISTLNKKTTVLPDGVTSAPSLLPKKSLIRFLVSPSLLKEYEECVFGICL